MGNIGKQKKVVIFASCLVIAGVAGWFKLKPDPNTAPLTRKPVHRYCFNNAPTNNASGAILVDSIGSEYGVVAGRGAGFTGKAVTLAGGDPRWAAYVSLPAGLLSACSTNKGGTGEITIEEWVSLTGNQWWGRFFDFGSRGVPGETGFEVTGPGGREGEGLDYIMYGQMFGDLENRRLEVHNEDPAGGGFQRADSKDPIRQLNMTNHIVFTWNERTGLIKVFENGKPVGTVAVNHSMSDIHDVNNWLGRSQFSADGNLQGEIDEFRIYDYVLTRKQIAGNEKCGPDKLNISSK